MIVEVLVQLACGVLGWVVSITPDFGLDLHLNMADAFEQLGNFASMLDSWFPVTTLGGCLAGLLILQAVLTVWGAIVWMYHQFWGAS